MTRKAFLAVPAVALLLAAVALAGTSLVGAGGANLTERRSAADVRAISPETLAPTVTGRDWREVSVSASKIGR